MAISASATGPMLPWAVESKVEQYFQYRRSAPLARSQFAASPQSRTAVSIGSVLHFRAMISISLLQSDDSLGNPKCSLTEAPLRLSRPARSVAPV